MCDPICSTCTLARNTFACTNCVTNYYFNDNKTACIECPSGTAKNPLTLKCVETCSSGYYIDKTDRLCKECYSRCVECTGASESDCT